ncbi:MAG: CCA tRNA nucleotidyltransferase [Bacillota bacterium]
MFSPGVRKVLDIINAAGREAYVVGGAVRDLLLGREPKEFDVCTDACPREVLTLAAENRIKAFKKGAAFGVTSWILDDEEIEIATFRTELYGNDAHRPEKVEFVWALEDDLARRDFTVNAIAMRADGSIVDPFEGRADLQAGVLRAVGDPEERFGEDALRMFRACRFVAEYGFTLDPETKAAIPRALQRVAGLSVERVRDEVYRTLMAEHAAAGLELMRETGLLAADCRGRVNGADTVVSVLPELARLAGVAQNPEYHQFDVWEHTLRVVENVPAEPVLRWAALLHDTAKGLPEVRGTNRRGLPTDYGHARKGAQITGRVMERLRFPPTFARRVTWLVRNHMRFPELEERFVRRWLKSLAPDFHSRQELLEAVGECLVLRRADLLGGKVDTLAVLDGNERLAEMVKDIMWRVPFYPEDLAITGGEVAALVGRGPQVKQVMEDLVVRVQGGQLDNRPVVLKEAVEKKVWRRKVAAGGRGPGGGRKAPRDRPPS